MEKINTRAYKVILIVASCIGVFLGSFTFSYALSTFATVQGGTGTTTPSGILYGDNGATNHLNTVTIGSNLTFVGGTLSAAGGGTVSTSTIPTVGQLPYWTSNGFPSLLGSVATTTITFSNFPANIPTTYGALVGGSNTTFNWWGLATTSQPSSSNLLVSNGTNGVFGVATTSASCSGGSSCSSFNVLGSSPITISSFSYPFPANATTTQLTFTNPIVGTQAASDNSTKAASTAYVTTGIANAIAGVNPAVAVQAATTQASDTSSLTYNNGVSGIGATFTGSNNTALTIDGYTFTALGQRLLVKNDTQSPSGAFNGIYYVTQVQTAILPPILTRALDYDMPSDINNTGSIPVVNGTANALTSWLLTSSVTTVGTDPLTYSQFSYNPSNIVQSVAQTYGTAQSGALTFATSSTAISNGWGITNIGGAFTFNLPTATASIRGLLSGTDWNTFNIKQAPGFQVATTTGLSVSNLAYYSTVTGTVLGGVATTSVTCTGNTSCSPFTAIGSSPITINSSGGGAFPFSADTNYGTTVYSTSTPTLWFKQGLYASSTNSVFSGLTIDNAAAGDTSAQFGAANHEWSVGAKISDNSFRISSSTTLGTNDLLEFDKSLNTYFGTTTNTTISAANPSFVTIDAGTKATEEWLNVIGNNNDFGEVNVMNLSSGASAQSCLTATGNTGNATTNFLSSCVNSTGFNNPQVYNAGIAGDADFISLANNLYIAQGTTGKKLFFLNGGTSNNSITATLDSTGGNNRFGIGSSTPWALLSVNAIASSTLTTLFAVASSTSSATTTLFSINNVGTLNINKLATPAGTFLAIDPSGNLIATTTPSASIATSFPTYQLLTATSSATYTTPANVKELHIIMCGAGGGGGNESGGSSGTNGTASQFGTGVASTTANGGTGAVTGNNPGGAGGTGGATNVGTTVARTNGNGGGAASSATSRGVQGGISRWGGQTAAATAGGQATQPQDSRCDGGNGNSGSGIAGPGGGAGEDVEFTVTSPAATYFYMDGTRGTGGGSGQGQNGSDGLIKVEEFYH